MTKNFHVLMFSVHGLIRYHHMELGRDADTGGQIKYVVELADELSKLDEIHQVDLFTRLIADKRVSEDYKNPVDKISEKFRIIRIQCGGRKYIRKELLWPHLDEFIDKTIKFIKRERLTPDIIHGHYADAGYIGIQLAHYFGTPFVFTGHSLGRTKQQKLSNEGMNIREMNQVYKIDHRIEVEEEVIQNSDLIITSTHQEIDQQYGMYSNRRLPRYCVNPPSIDLEKFYPYYRDMLPDTVHKDEESMRAHASVLEELNRFFKNPEKPIILALCRAERRKNISGLIDAYGSEPELKALANLAIFAGLRKNIVDMPDNEKEVLTEMLLLMDKYDLYGKMAIPKKHDFTFEVPELYRITAQKRGVFVNVALTEPFGLSLIEASASGLPIVATNDGGPKDIIKNCQNGILVDPINNSEICNAIKTIIINEEKWKQYSTAGIEGVNNHYNWSAHVSRYLNEIRKISRGTEEIGIRHFVDYPIGDRFTKLQHFIMTDIDDTLIGDDEALEQLMVILKDNIDTIGFGLATGRTIESAMSIVEKYNLIFPDVIISSVGSEIYYRGKSIQDKGWKSHISKKWNREKIRRILNGFNYLKYQEEDTQRECKISYYMEDKKDRLAEIHQILNRNKCHYNLIYSHGKFLDILPHRASKGKAIRYLMYKWEFDAGNVIVCGDSGNDEEMLTINTPGVVVANYKKELESLKKKNNIYFANGEYACGIIQGLKKFKFIENASGKGRN